MMSMTFLECTFGPTKDGFMVKDLMASIDNELLCKGQSTQFCDCREDEEYTMAFGQMVSIKTKEEWGG